MSARVALASAVLWLAACTSDFGAFEFAKPDAENAPENGDGDGDAGADGGTVIEDASMTEDASTTPDMCELQWDAASFPDNGCKTCACADCTPSVSACFGVGTPAEQALCAGVLECALANDCEDWTCYCTSPSCGSLAASGNGPCAAEMDAAAGGTRADVMAIREAGNADEPLVRAMNAIGCVIGLDSHSPGGPVAGQCDDFCP